MKFEKSEISYIVLISKIVKYAYCFPIPLKIDLERNGETIFLKRKALLKQY